MSFTKPSAVLAIAAALGLIGLGLIGFGGHALVERRRRRGGVKIAGTQHLNARWWREQGTKAGELLYAAIGDSAAQGVGASRPGHGYVGLIARHLRDRTGRTVRVVNLSVSGARISDALDVQLPALGALAPDIVTVAIGANDVPSFDRQRFQRELGTLYDSLPKGTIVAEVPSFYLGARERNARIANTILHRLAARHGFPVAPLHRRTRRQTAVRYALNQVAADFFHPNDRGYRVWASAFLPLVDRVLGPKGAEPVSSGVGGLA
ncbi:MAG: SGNH/GDSL hydrolase family protein [Actinomycetota bacterium]